MIPRAPDQQRVAVVGHGAIGRVLVRELLARQAPARSGDTAPGANAALWPLRLVGVMVREAARAAPPDDLPAGVPVVDRLDALLALRPTLVVEAAGQQALREIGVACLRAGCDVLAASVGALADATLAAELEDAARAGGAQLLLPAGALGALDALGAARLAGLHQVRYRARKPPLAWRGTPAEAQLDLGRLTQATVFFTGTAREAALAYPKNANVAATLALATLGMDGVQVELVADPAAPGNVHEIEAAGAAGMLRLELLNHPSPDNPRTSLLTPYSLLQRILSRCAAVSV